ncbi:MAG: glycosyltransferase family 39 protein [Deltaproteobacteria bacterium]|nr:glycosyltransferase family 39 protein [Deltaproteobacteria bacterium]
MKQLQKSLSSLYLPVLVKTMFWLFPALLSVLVGLVVIDAGFVSDDSIAISNNPIVTQGLSLGEALQRDFCGTPLSQPSRVLVWRPLLPIAWKYIWKLGDGSAVPFRVATLVLHLLTTMTVLAVGKKLLSNKSILFMTGILFSVHPIHSEVLGSLVSQADIVSTMLGMVGIWIALAHVRRWRQSILLVIVLGLACLAKETAVIFCGIIIVIAWVQGQTTWGERLAKSFPALLIGVAIIVFQILIERGGRNPINNLAYCATGFERTLHGLYIIGRSISMCFIPVGLTPSHDYAAVDLSLSTLLPYSLLAVLLLILCCAFFLRAVETHNIAWISGIALLVGPAFIQSSLVVCVNTEFAERLLYSSSIAGSAITAALLFVILKRPVYRWIGFTLVAGLFLLQSWHVGKQWRDNITLFEYAVGVEPLSWRAHNNYAMSLARKKEIEEALWHYMVAAYILSHRPLPVTPTPIFTLSKFPIAQRLIEGPAVFSPNDPRHFIKFYFDHLIAVFNFPHGVAILAPYYKERY